MHYFTNGKTYEFSKEKLKILLKATGEKNRVWRMKERDNLPENVITFGLLCVFPVLFRSIWWK